MKKQTFFSILLLCAVLPVGTLLKEPKSDFNIKTESGVVISAVQKPQESPIVAAKAPAVERLLAYQKHVKPEELMTLQNSELATESYTPWQKEAVGSIQKVRERYGTLISKASKKTGLSEDFITSIIVVESFGNPSARSNKHAEGLMQITPVAAKEVGLLHKNLYNPEENIHVGTTYLASLRDRYGYKSQDKMAVAYNAGPTFARTLTDQEISNQTYAKRISFVIGHL